MLLNFIFITKEMWLVRTIKICWGRDGGSEGKERNKQKKRELQGIIGQWEPRYRQLPSCHKRSEI